jgi:hypothetical protein
MPAAAIREIAIRWGYDPDALTDEQRDLIEDTLRCWAE